MKNISSNKVKQLRVFFRFLKDLGMYNTYRNLFSTMIEDLSMYSAFSNYNKSELFEKLLNHYIYNRPANLYTEIFYSHIKFEDFCALRELWSEIVIDYRIKHISEENIFNEYEISRCKKNIR